MMSKLFKSGLVLLLVFALVWLGVIIWWQESLRLPTATDIAVYLFVLPIALIVAFIGVKAVVKKARAAPAEPPAAAAAPTTEASATAAPVAAPRLAVIASSVATAVGNDAAAVVRTLRENPRPELDAALTDSNGFPVFAMRVPELDADALREALVQAHPPSALMWNGATVRALCLLIDACTALVEQALLHPGAQADGAGHDTAAVQLRVDLLLPTRWDSTLRESAALFMRDTLGEMWPPERLRLTVHPVDDDRATLDLLDLLAFEQSQAATPPQLCLVAACDSYIDRHTVSMWEQQRTLMLSANQQGRIPGEAAGALLLSTPVLARELVRPPTLLSSAMRVQRAAPADGKRSADQPLPDLANALLASHQVPADQVIAVISDADHRGNRAAEALQLTSAAFPHLDPIEDGLCVGSTCGYLGAAATMVAIALASDTSAQTDLPVLVALVQPTHFRAALLVAPEASDASSPTF